jgi:hypothetical protein
MLRLVDRIKYVKQITICLAIVGCTTSVGDKPQRTKELERVLPLVAIYQVEDYRNQDWCKNLVYQQGKYSNNNRSSTCNLFKGKAIAFNEESNRVFGEIESALKQVGTTVHFFDVKYDRNNRIGSAKFEIDCGGFCRNRFVYEPGYRQLPENAGTEFQYSRIDRDWYFVVEDWN